MIWRSIKFLLKLTFLPITLPFIGGDITRVGGYGTLLDTRLHGRIGNNRADANRALKEEDFRIPRAQGGGGGGLMTLNNRIVDISGAGYGAGEQGEDYTVGYGAGYGDVRIGWRVAEGKRWRVYPFLGYGGGGYGMGATVTDGTIEKNISSEGSYGQVQMGLAMDGYITLWRLRWLLGVRLGIMLMRDTQKSRVRPFVQVISGSDVERKQEQTPTPA
jgi:hypothetical protein